MPLILFSLGFWIIWEERDPPSENLTSKNYALEIRHGHDVIMIKYFVKKNSSLPPNLMTCFVVLQI